MMQTQSKQLIWDEEGQPKNVYNPVLCQCPIQLLATVDSHTVIAKRKYDDQVWTGREINRPTIDLNMIWNQSTSTMD